MDNEQAIQEFVEKIDAFVKSVKELQEIGLCAGNADSYSAHFSLTSLAKHAKRYGFNPVIKKTDHTQYEYTISIPELRIHAIGNLSEIVRLGLIEIPDGYNEYEKSEFARMRIKLCELEMENKELRENK
jgi:hypothetical protein